MTIRQRVRFEILRHSWIWRCRWRSAAGLLTRNWDWVRQGLYVLVATSLGLLLAHQDGAKLSQEVLSGYLFTLGAMTGGTIAIVFTISLFLLQNASDLYSSEYLEVYIHDRREQFIYLVVIVITLALLGGGLWVGGLDPLQSWHRAMVVGLSLSLTGLVFALIDFQYKSVLRKISPASAIEFLERKGLTFLRRQQRDAEGLAGVVGAQNQSATREQILAAIHGRLLRPSLTTLDRELGNLLAIAIKLSDRNESQTAHRALGAVRAILLEYLEMRRSSSVASASRQVLLAVESDSHAFLQPHLERLVHAAEHFMREGRDEDATVIAWVFAALADKAQHITYVGAGSGNPILDQVVGNYGTLIQHGVRSQNIEAAFQGATVLGGAARIAAAHALSATLLGIQGKLLEVAMFGLAQRNTAVVDRSTDALLGVLPALFAAQHIDRHLAFKVTLQHLATIAQFSALLEKAGHMGESFSARESLCRGYNGLYEVVAGIVARDGDIQDARERRAYRADTIELLHEVNASIRGLSERVKDCDGILVEAVGRLLRNLNEMIVQMIRSGQFADEADELRERLRWNIGLPGWFFQHAPKCGGTSMAVDALVESVARTGVLAAHVLQDWELVETCARSLSSIAKQVLEKAADPYGHDSPRVFRRALFLGILAMKAGKQGVADDVGQRALEFQAQYMAKRAAEVPAGVRVQVEPLSDLLGWRNDFEHERLNGFPRLMDDAESLMYGLVLEVDIDRFMYEVWKWAPGGSALLEEVRLKACQEIALLVGSLAEERARGEQQRN